MQSFMEIIYIDSEDQARQTNLRAAKDSNASTWAAFNSYRDFAVDIKRAKFLLDYHNAKGDLADTIPLDAAGFRAITSKDPLTDSAYCKIDDEFWADVRRQSEAA